MIRYCCSFHKALIFNWKTHQNNRVPRFSYFLYPGIKAIVSIHRDSVLHNVHLSAKSSSSAAWFFLAENVLALIYKDPHQPGFKILRWFSQSLYIFIAG